MEQHVWYRNGGGLTLELCEVEEFQSTNIPERCCSCNEAKYEVSRKTIYCHFTKLKVLIFYSATNFFSKISISR